MARYIELQAAHLILENRGLTLYAYHDKGLSLFAVNEETGVLTPRDELSRGALKDLIKDAYAIG
jgi:hypothetical protein